MRTARRPALVTLAVALTASLVPVGGAAAAPAATHRHHDRGTELTLVYVYAKVDPAARATWANSGTQRLVLVREGHAWTRSLDADLLPDDVCGVGWAVQEDQTRGLARRDVPDVVDRRTGVGVLGWPPIVAARHRDLAELVDVPACEPDGPTPPAVTPTPETPGEAEVPVVPPTTPAAPAVPVPAAPTFTG